MIPSAQLGTMAVRGYPIDADYLMAKVAEEYGERARDALYRIIRHMPPTEPEQRWIPVSERLPDKSNFYICTKKNRLVKTVWYSVLEETWEENVIAWMPLPQPYQEEGE